MIVVSVELLQEILANIVIRLNWLLHIYRCQNHEVEIFEDVKFQKEAARNEDRLVLDALKIRKRIIREMKIR